MAVLSGFFNSIVTDGAKDREYDARDMAQLFEGLILDGVFQSIGNGMLVKAATGLSVTVSTGRAWFNRTYTHIDAALPITLPASHTILNRIDAVVLEVNHSPGVRKNSIKVIQGVPATAPKNPTLTKSELVNHYPLAYVYRAEGSTDINQGNITNTIGTFECPFVIGVTKTINTDQLLAQWTAQWEKIKVDEKVAIDEWIQTQEAAWNVWFSNIENKIGSDAAAEIAVKLAALDVRVKKLEETDAAFKKLLNVAVTSPKGARQIFVQPKAPTVEEGAKEGDIWFEV